MYCRYVSNHVDIHCPAAAARYLRDYPDLQQYPELDAFDHYNAVEGGKSEGRIWHTELCEADGTNKASHCQIIHTSDQYEYTYITGMTFSLLLAPCCLLPAACQSARDLVVTL